MSYLYRSFGNASSINHNVFSILIEQYFIDMYGSILKLYQGLWNTLFQKLFILGIFCMHLTWLFAERICRGNLLLVFFVYVRESFFVYVSKSCLYGSRPLFICEQNFLIRKIFFINSVSFCYYCDSYGQRSLEFLILYLFCFFITF